MGFASQAAAVEAGVIDEEGRPEWTALESFRLAVESLPRVHGGPEQAWACTVEWPTQKSAPEGARTPWIRGLNGNRSSVYG